MPKSNSKGFVLIFPVIVVGAILLLSLTFSSFKSHNVQTSSVLSESSSNDEDDDNSGSGSSNSGSGKSESTAKPTSKPPEFKESPKPQFFSTTTSVKFGSSKEQELKKKPESQTPKASPKPKQTFEPKQTEKPEIEDEDENENEVSTPKPFATPEPSNSKPELADSLTLLPEDAVKNILESNAVSQVDQDNLKLTTNDNGVPVYEVEGIKQGRFLGIFKVNIKKRVQISAVDGAEGSVTVSGFDKFLDMLSF